MNREDIRKGKITHSMEFDGDIIITDPCYILKDDDTSADLGRLSKIGIPTSISRDTLYGDWSCTVFDDDTHEQLGQFCADAGMVAVMLLEEVLHYNPSFDYHINRPWTTTLIKNFKGTVQFVIVHETGEYEEDTQWWKKGDKWEDDAVVVVGDGVNKDTGETISFVGLQTGL